MLTLERLEDRLVPDAMLALAFQQQLVPALARQHDAIEQAIIREAEYIVTVASAQAQIMGPQFTAANLPPVLSAAQKLVAYLPTERASFYAMMSSAEMALYQLPYDPHELSFIAQTSMQLNALTGVMPF